MSLQNRVLPGGELVSESWRGEFMGNRGGRIHDPATRMLLKRRWASKRWICCLTNFKNRQRTVMGGGYTELFFLDEVSALACGHRPCFECRRKDANRFSRHWANAQQRRKAPTADEMDIILHDQRTGERPIIKISEVAALPDGIMVQASGKYFAKHRGGLVVWTGSGYAELLGELVGTVRLLTPEGVVAALGNGYLPKWHNSASGVLHGHP